MIRSMTGFGEAERETEAGTLRVEIRTVNHRHLSVNFRTPASLAKWEPQMRDWLRAHLSRGHANVAVRLEPAAGTSAAAVGLKLDEERVQAYLALFNELRERFGVGGEPDLAQLLRFSDVIVRDDEGDPHRGAGRRPARGGRGRGARHLLHARGRGAAAAGGPGGAHRGHRRGARRHRASWRRRGWRPSATGCAARWPSWRRGWR